jgi:hypothetical protein
MAETQPKLNPALWRLPAMISQSSPTVVCLLIVQNHLRCGFAEFKLSAHFLDLRTLLLELLGKLRDGCLQLLNFALQHALLGGG